MIYGIFAHPDDEVLACGGALAKHTSQGDEVSVLILGSGLASRNELVSQESFDVLRKQCKDAMKILGVEQVIFNDFPDNQFDQLPLLSLVKAIEKETLNKPISHVYTHYHGDLNIDHQMVAQAVITAFRPCVVNTSIKILAGEVNSSTEWGNFNGMHFSPNSYLNIETVLDKKIAAMNCYQSELRDWPHPRSLEGIKIKAQQRGMESGLLFAEAYQVLLEINR